MRGHLSKILCCIHHGVYPALAGPSLPDIFEVDKSNNYLFSFKMGRIKEMREIFEILLIYYGE